MKCRSLLIWTISVTFVLFMSCSSDDSVAVNPQQRIDPKAFAFVHFDPTANDLGQIPLPNNLLRSPITGRINLPEVGAPAIDGLIQQVNTLQGFSTSAPVRIPFVGKINPDSVHNGTVMLVDLVDLAAAEDGADVDPMRELRLEVRDDDTGENSVIFGFPVKPLTPGHSHLVVVTQGVIGTESGLPVESEALTVLLKGDFPFVDAEGNSTRISLDNATAQQLEPLRQAYQPVWELAESVTGQGRHVIPFAFAFSTQPLFDTLSELHKRAQETNPIPVIALGIVGNAQVSAFLNSVGFGFVPHDQIGALFLGSFQAPNYINHPLTGPFEGSGAEVVEVSTATVTFIAALPISGQSPYPTMIFQHGIGGAKEDGIGIVNGANAAGIAVVGIDLVLHGDRTPDVINNTTGAPEPDGLSDPSGANFINLQNLLMTRDNIRQSVADLFALTRMISSGAMDFNFDGAPELDSENISFLGASLGGVVGATFVAMEPRVNLADLNVSGARFAYLLNQSQAFGPGIDAALESFGLPLGSPLYDAFFIFAQSVVDDADGFNYGGAFVGTGEEGPDKAILIQEMINDEVVPNSSTEDLAHAFGIPQVDAIQEISGLQQVSAPHQGSGLYQFEGAHPSIINPASGPTEAIQLQAFTFLLTGLMGQPTIINPFATQKRGSGVGTGIERKIDPEVIIRYPNE